MWFRRRKPEPTWEQIVAAHEQRREVSRACGDIVRALLDSPSAAHQTLLLTSSQPSEGKTTVALHLGAMLATRGRSVLLVDCHFQRPDLGRFLGVTDRPGLTDLLESGGRPEDGIAPDRRLPRLGVLPRGTKEFDIVQPDVEDRLRGILERARTAYDFILLDGGPVTSGPENLLAAPLVDGVVLVVACDQTQVAEVASTTRRLAARGATLAGAIVSRDPGYLPGYYRKA